MIRVNPLTDDKIFCLSKLNSFANASQNIKIVHHRIENIVDKEEIAGYQHFLLFPQYFQKAFPPVRQNSSLCGNGLKEKKYDSTCRQIALYTRGSESLNTFPHNDTF